MVEVVVAVVMQKSNQAKEKKQKKLYVTSCCWIFFYLLFALFNVSLHTQIHTTEVYGDFFPLGIIFIRHTSVFHDDSI